MLAGWVFAQSKGAGIGLAVSGIVVLAVSPARLRLLPPLALALAPAAAAYRPLTAAYRADFTAGFDHAFHQGGWAMLAVALAGVVLGAVYAGIDRAVEPGPRARRVLGGLAAGAACLAIVGGIAAFLAAEPHPGRFAADRWHSFKHLPTSETTSSHFLSLGSNRYDFWRVALRRVRPPPGLGHRRRRVPGRLPDPPPQQRDTGAGALGRARPAGRERARRVAALPGGGAAAARGGGARRAAAHAQLDRRARSGRRLARARLGRLDVDVPGRGRSRLRAARHRGGGTRPETRRARVSMRARRGRRARRGAARLHAALGLARGSSRRRSAAPARRPPTCAGRSGSTRFSTAPYLAEASSRRTAGAPRSSRSGRPSRSSRGRRRCTTSSASRTCGPGCAAQARRELRTALALDPGDFLIARALRRAG